MTDRSNSEVQLAFNVMAARLDRLLAKAKPYLKEQGVEIYDNCNRSGTDMSGYPYFTWSYEFMVDEELEGDIYRREVRLKYLEPWETEETHKRNQMDVQTIAEIFRKRSAPRFEWSDRSVWLIDAMGAEGLHKLLDVQFAIADKQLNPGTGLIVFPHYKVRSPKGWEVTLKHESLRYREGTDIYQFGVENGGSPGKNYLAVYVDSILPIPADRSLNLRQGQKSGIIKRIGEALDALAETYKFE